MEETKMSIAGINGYNYSNYYTGIKRNTAKANGMNSGLLSNVSSTSSNITLHMSGTEDSGNALTAVGFPDGSSASVYKSDAYDSANPEYRVRYWDKEGNYTDTNVQINDVDPRNASYTSLYIRISLPTIFTSLHFPISFIFFSCASGSRSANTSSTSALTIIVSSRPTV